MSVPEPADQDVDLLVKYVREKVKDQTNWSAWPGGWPDDIESALIDAVFSARARYRTSRGHGVYGQVTNWQAARTRTDFGLDQLLREIDTIGIAEWMSRFEIDRSRPGDQPKLLVGVRKLPRFAKPRKD